MEEWAKGRTKTSRASACQSLQWYYKIYIIRGIVEMRKLKLRESEEFTQVVQVFGSVTACLGVWLTVP